MAHAPAAPTKPLGFFEQIGSYNATFWFANFMEMMERWAYYGVRSVVALYMVGATATGGLNFTHIQKGNIYLWWAIIQSFLPMFTGGISDTFGYKKTISLAIVLKIVGYGLMATSHDFMGFAMGCFTLATGTAIFKPGVQGLIAHNVHEGNASLGWGIFYQLVNIGGFLGPITASLLRPHTDGKNPMELAAMTAAGETTWMWLFVGNAVLVSVNFLTLLMFKEPEVPRPAGGNSLGDVLAKVGHLIYVSLKDLMVPRLALFILIFSGFWFSFNQLFDLLPNFIDDWVDTTMITQQLAHVPVLGWFFGTTPGVAVPPETMVNLNPAAIVFFMLPVAFLASRAPALVAITVGIAVSLVGILAAGYSVNGWMCALGILVFSFGEMLASPRTNDYMASIAPVEKKGQFLGYANVPVGIGWAAGSVFAGHFYEEHGDKVNFARQHLQTALGMSEEAVKAIPKEQVMPTLAEKLHMGLPQAQQFLWETYHPATVWYWIAAVGFVSLVGMLVYNEVIRRLDARKDLPWPHSHLDA